MKKKKDWGLSPLPLWHPQIQAIILHALGLSEQCAHIFIISL